MSCHVFDALAWESSSQATAWRCEQSLTQSAANDCSEPKAGTAEGHLASYDSSIPYLIALVVTDSITFGGASQAVQQSI